MTFRKALITIRDVTLFAMLMYVLLSFCNMLAYAKDDKTTITNTNETNMESTNDNTNSNNNRNENTNDVHSDSRADANNTVTYSVANNNAASAAPVFSTGCVNGGSVQGVKGGFSIGSISAICRNLMMADAYLRLAGMAEGEELKAAHMGIAITYLEDAGMVVKRTSKTAFIAQVSQDLAIPLIAILALLILL